MHHRIRRSTAQVVHDGLAEINAHGHARIVSNGHTERAAIAVPMAGDTDRTGCHSAIDYRNSPRLILHDGLAGIEGVAVFRSANRGELPIVGIRFRIGCYRRRACRILDGEFQIGCPSVIHSRRPIHDCLGTAPCGHLRVQWRANTTTHAISTRFPRPQSPRSLRTSPGGQTVSKLFKRPSAEPWRARKKMYLNQKPQAVRVAINASPDGLPFLISFSH